MLICICAWCKKFMGFRRMKITYFLRTIFTLKFRRLLSHGICPQCSEIQNKEIDEYKNR